MKLMINERRVVSSLRVEVGHCTQPSQQQVLMSTAALSSYGIAAAAATASGGAPAAGRAATCSSPFNLTVNVRLTQ